MIFGLSFLFSSFRDVSGFRADWKYLRPTDLRSAHTQWTSSPLLCKLFDTKELVLGFSTGGKASPDSKDLVETVRLTANGGAVTPGATLAAIP